MREGSSQLELRSCSLHPDHKTLRNLNMQPQMHFQTPKFRQKHEKQKKQKFTLCRIFRVLLSGTSGTKVLPVLTKSYSEANENYSEMSFLLKATKFIRNSSKMSFFPEDFWGAKPLKNYEQKFSGNYFRNTPGFERQLLLRTNCGGVGAWMRTQQFLNKNMWPVWVVVMLMQFMLVSLQTPGDGVGHKSENCSKVW